MTVTDILNELQKRGIDIELAGENIRLHGSSENDLDESLVESIKIHKAELIKLLSIEAGMDLKGRPVWCTECQHGGYKTEDTGSQALCCGLADQAVMDMKKCIMGYWIKNEKGWPITLQ